MALVTELTELTMSEERRKWTVRAWGSFIAGSTRDRAVRITAGKLMYCGIKEPLYDINGGSGNLYNEETDIGAGDSVMIGTIQVVEVFYRELTGERSIAGIQTNPLTMETKCKVMIESTSVTVSNVLYVSHREFYVNFVDELGTYYLAARIPYTGDADSTVINVSATKIVNNRPLEDQLQTSLYPAVKTAAFWRSRIFGAVLEPRELADGATITLTNGSNIATLSGDEFIESDLYHGIVDRSTNNIMATITRIISPTEARIIPQGNTDLNPVWDEPTVTLDPTGLSGDESMIYASPIYVGEAGGGLTYGMLTWNPLDQLRDEGFYSSGAKIAKVIEAGEELCVIYDCGIAFYQGNISVDAPPQVRQYVAAKNIGALQPDEVWQTPDGAIWFRGNGKFFCIQNGRAVEIARSMGNEDFFGRWVGMNPQALDIYQARYNPSRDIALMIGLPKKEDSELDLGKWAVVINHSTQTVHPLRFPVRFTSLHSVIHNDGVWQYYAGTDNGNIYKVLVDGKSHDTYWDITNNEIDNVPIAVEYIGGVDWFDGNIYSDSVRICINTDATSDMDVDIDVDFKKGNLNSARFVPDISHSFQHNDVNHGEYLKLYRMQGYGIQYRFRLNNTQEYALVNASVIEEVQNARGRG